MSFYITVINFTRFYDANFTIDIIIVIIVIFRMSL